MSLDISVLIRTCNSAGTLQEVLARMALQPADEIIVVDSGSTDETLKIAQRHHARILTSAPPFNYSKSLNLGFMAAKNPWVMVISSHCIPLSENLVDCFRKAALTFPTDVAVAYGECCLIEPQEILDSAVLFADKTANAQQRQRVFGGNTLALYRRACWQEQPFDETLHTTEDLAWLFQALEKGALVARVPLARALYRNQGSLRYMFSKGWRESRQAFQLTGGAGMSFFQLGINWGSLLKKWGMGKIPASALLRQSVHALGFCLASNLRASK